MTRYIGLAPITRYRRPPSLGAALLSLAAAALLAFVVGAFATAMLLLVLAQY